MEDMILVSSDDHTIEPPDRYESPELLWNEFRHRARGIDYRRTKGTGR
jgi:hypothetical protein